MKTDLNVGDIVRLTPSESWFEVKTITGDGGFMFLNGRRVHPMDPIEVVRGQLPEVKELNGDNLVEVFLKYRTEYLSTIGVK
tara:strand:+ start:233 stop:478 length:246 start_codon:yes stop_codon:yes gene_type:complete